LRVYTSQNGFVWYYLVPLGMLPWMFIGSTYEYGRPNGVVKSGTFNFKLPRMSDIRFVPFSDMPVSLRENRKNPEITKEYVCKFVSGERTYYIPQMEIIRAFLGMNSSMSKYILSPSGFEDLCRVVSADDENVELEFSKRFARNSLNYSTASCVATQLLDQNFRDFRHSVYECFRLNDQSQLFKPSGLDNLTFYCIGRWSGNDYLVWQISSVKNINVPFDNLLFSHVNDSSAERSGVDTKDKKVYIPRRGEDGYEVTGSDYSRRESNPITMWNETAKVSYGFNKKVHCKRKESKKDRQYKATIRIDKGKAPDSNLLSAGIGVGDSKIKPLEIDNVSLYETYKKDIRGLEDFLRAVEYLKTMIPVERVHIGSLFGDKKFVMLDENIRRSYAIVYLQNAFIIEVARPDDHSIATLILKNISEKQFNYYLRPLLTSMIGNGGHWSLEFLNTHLVGKHFISKHMQSDGCRKWGLRLEEKLYR